MLISRTQQVYKDKQDELCDVETLKEINRFVTYVSMVNATYYR